MKVHRNQEASSSICQVKKEEEEEVNHQVNKKILITSSNIAIPNIQHDAYNRETMKNLTAFWNANSREWFLSNFKKDTCIDIPQNILIGSQILQDVELIKTPPKMVKEEEICNADSVDSDDCKDTNDCLSDSSSKGDNPLKKSIPVLNQALIPIFGNAKSTFKPCNVSEVSFSLFSNIGGFDTTRKIPSTINGGHTIVIPKPIRPKVSY